MKSTLPLPKRLSTILEVLGPLWPRAVPLLDHRSCFELLCAVVLSAQCTDDQVNRVTPSLFATWPDAAAMAGAAPEAVGLVIHSTGFYRTKALHLVGLSKLLLEQHGGKVPESMEELLELPGVGRKTANLVLSSCFGQPGIIVDTHVLRVAFRLGIENRRDPLLVEKAIAANLEKASWTAFSHAVNRHGKWVCTARKPGCGTCPIRELCPRKGMESMPSSH